MIGDNANKTTDKKTISGECEKEAGRELHPYHTPVLVHYGSLAELVQHNPALGSDGGTADCQHL
jgi:hypothetical protein